MAFKPVKLFNSEGEQRTARTAAEEAKMRHDGWRSTPLKKSKTAEKAPAKADAKPTPKN
jgi:hypothetical protein